MKHASPTRQRLAALGLFGLVLLNFPLLGLPEGVFGGWPSTWLYLFGVWAGMIGLAAWIAERRGR